MSFLYIDFFLLYVKVFLLFCEILIEMFVVSEYVLDFEIDVCLNIIKIG